MKQNPDSSQCKLQQKFHLKLSSWVAESFQTTLSPPPGHFESCKKIRTPGWLGRNKKPT